MRAWSSIAPDEREGRARGPARASRLRPSIAAPFRLSALLALLVYAALLALSAPPWPDDWDGIGFVESVRDFDMSRYRPHPPGYPVYVALLRLAAHVAQTPMGACTVTAVASGALAVALTWDAVRRATCSARAAWTAAGLCGLSPLAWRAFSGPGSEGPALACAAACAWGLVRSRQEEAGAPRRATVGPGIGALVLGLGAGLGLGVRLSWGPAYVAALALAPKAARARSWGLAAAGCVAWGVPLLAIVGPARLAALYAAQGAGHAARWGGTVLTEPGARRAGWLARDVLVDGLGVGADPLGIAIGALIVLAAAQSLLTWRRARWRGWPMALAIVLPYLLWIAVGQNLRDQPRHALPLVVLLAAALAVPTARSRAAAGLVGGLLWAVAIRTMGDARARRSIPPPGEQLVLLARAQPEPAKLAIFGVASVRFFETSAPPPFAFTAATMGDVQARLARLDSLPTRVWVTGEIAHRAAQLAPVATLCRPPRLDRRAPCLAVYSWPLPFLRRQ